ncbi:hypothetical protein R1flu_004218 [Riccia fluitans]|uniref:Uncharacterized protein n=1 Tax=Riccia fluitans TaxID=41844 RepID=A0ABD1YSL8_9MARC
MEAELPPESIRSPLRNQERVSPPDLATVGRSRSSELLQAVKFVEEALGGGPHGAAAKDFRRSLATKSRRQWLAI